MEKRPTKIVDGIELRVEHTELPTFPGTTHRGRPCYGIATGKGNEARSFFYGYTSQAKAAAVMDKFTTADQVRVNLAHPGPQQVSE